MKKRRDLVTARVELLAGLGVEGEELGRNRTLKPLRRAIDPPSASLACPVNSPAASTNTTPFTITGGSAVKCYVTAKPVPVLFYRPCLFTLSAMIPPFGVGP